MSRRIPVGLLLSTLLPVIAAAAPGERGEAQSALTEADTAYQQGDFEKARKAYQALVDRGYDGATVLYNLGNASLRSGRLGEAIACYQRAARLAPRDRDIRANLEYAYRKRPMGEPAPPAMWLDALWRKLVGSFTLSELAGAAAVLYWLGAVLAALLIRRGGGRRLRRALWLVAILFVLVTTAAIGRWWNFHHVARGVVVAKQTEVRSGPGESFEIVQRVREGRMVRIVRSDGDWMQVVAEGGAHGWLPSNVVTVTQP